MTADNRGALTRLAAVYFCIYGALGALHPYFSLLFAARGMTPLEMAAVFLCVPLASLVAPPIWGAVADWSGARARLLSLATFGTAAAVALLMPQWGVAGAVFGMAVFALMSRPLGPLADAAVHSFLGQAHARFGRIRVWGSLGFTLVVLASGYLSGADAKLWRLGVGGLLFLVASGLAWGIVAGPGVAAGASVVQQARRALARPALTYYMLGTVCYFGVQYTHDSFFSYYVRGLGLSDSIIGVAWAGGVCIEMLIMVGAPVLFRWASPATWLIGCGIIAAGRWAVLGVSAAAGLLVVLQGLHGVTFGLWYVASVAWLQARAPENLRASFQAVMSAAMGIGAAVFVMAGGWIIGAYGMPHFYVLGATAAVLAALFYGVALRSELPQAAAGQSARVAGEGP